MSRASWALRQTAAAVLAIAALAVAAEAAPPAPQGPFLLRGSQVAPAPPPPAVQPPATPLADAGVGPGPPSDLSPIPRFQDDPAPRFGFDAAPRVAGLEPRGGAACRTRCADTRYQCRAAEDSEVCDGAWSQCVAACPENSSSPL